MICIWFFPQVVFRLFLSSYNVSMMSANKTNHIFMLQILINSVITHKLLASSRFHTHSLYKSHTKTSHSDLDSHPLPPGLGWLWSRAQLKLTWMGVALKALRLVGKTLLDKPRITCSSLQWGPVHTNHDPSGLKWQTSPFIIIHLTPGKWRKTLCPGILGTCLSPWLWSRWSTAAESWRLPKNQRSKVVSGAGGSFCARTPVGSAYTTVDGAQGQMVSWFSPIFWKHSLLLFRLYSYSTSCFPGSTLSPISPTSLTTDSS